MVPRPPKLSPTACEAKENAPRIGEGLVRRPDRCRRYSEARSGENRLASHGEVIFKEATIKRARPFEARARYRRRRFFILLFSRNVATNCLSGLCGNIAVTLRVVVRRRALCRRASSARSSALLSCSVRFGVCIAAAIVGCRGCGLGPKNRGPRTTFASTQSLGKLSTAQRPVQHTRRSDSSSGA